MNIFSNFFQFSCRNNKKIPVSYIALLENFYLAQSGPPKEDGFSCELRRLSTGYLQFVSRVVIIASPLSWKRSPVVLHKSIFCD